jgi:hypothetical protein
MISPYTCPTITNSDQTNQHLARTYIIMHKLSSNQNRPNYQGQREGDYLDTMLDGYLEAVHGQAAGWNHG